MRRRRRSRPGFDTRAIPVVAVVLFIGSAYAIPGLAFAEACAFALIACTLWLVGGRRRINELHRWGAVTNLYALSPEDFERHVAATYAALGYKVSLTKRIGDQGIDVVAERSQERIGIQCKRTTETVSNSAVQEAYAGKAHYRCTSGAVVSLGGFTAPARALAATTGINLMDGNAYADLFHRATATLPTRSVWSVIPRGRILLSALSCAVVALLAVALGTARATFPPMSVAPSATTASEPLSKTPSSVVDAFYSSIGKHDFRAAYALLSPGFKSSLPFEAFRRGYSTTLGAHAITSEGNSDTTVYVHLIATDQNRDGSRRTTTYDGYWKVVADPKGGWLLDDGRFHRT